MIFQRMTDRMPHAAAGQVKHDVDVLQDPGQQRRIPQIAADDLESALGGAVLQVLRTSRRKIVDDAHRAIGERIDKVGADKARATRDENCTPRKLQWGIPWISSKPKTSSDRSLQILSMIFG